MRGDRICPKCNTGLSAEKRPHAVYCSEKCRANAAALRQRKAKDLLK